MLTLLVSVTCVKYADAWRVIYNHAGHHRSSDNCKNIHVHNDNPLRASHDYLCYILLLLLYYLGFN